INAFVAGNASNLSRLLSHPGWYMESCLDRLCCHTRKSVEPGRYSQRATKLERSSLKLKSGLSKANCSVASPITYRLPCWLILFLASKRNRLVYVRERVTAANLKSLYLATEVNGDP